MGRRILVVANQRKLHGARAARYHGVIAGLRERGHDIEERAIAPSHDGVAISSTGGTEQVVIAGGDGTVNRVLQSWVAYDVPLAILPLGTCNLVARECGYPLDVDGLVELIHANRPAEIYVARANGQVCAIAAGCGIDSFVADRIVWQWKKRFGRAYVVWKSLGGLLSYRAPKFEVRVDGEPVYGSSVFVLKGRYYGGLYSVSRDSTVFEPFLYSAVNEHRSAWRQLAMIVGVFTRNLDRVERVLTIRRAREVEITGPPGFPVQLDGDVRLRTPVRIVVSETPLLLCVPAASTRVRRERASAQQSAD